LQQLIAGYYQLREHLLKLGLTCTLICRRCPNKNEAASHVHNDLWGLWKTCTLPFRKSLHELNQFITLTIIQSMRLLKG